MGGGSPSPEREGENLVIILPFPRLDAQIDLIRKKHPHIKVTYHQLRFQGNVYKGAEQLPKEIFESATILATLSALPPHPSDAPKLKLIHFFSAGVDHVMNSPIYNDTDIALTTSSGIHGANIAEWVVMTQLAHSHRLKLLMQWQKDREWGNHEKVGTVHDMVGQRIGILGYGSIGRQVARVSQAMGMTVLAYTASPRPTADSRRDDGYIIPGTGDADGTIPSAWFSGLSKASLHDFLAQDLDVLLVSVPLTEQTTHFLGAEEFEILGKKKNAFISNISRGKILVQDDLIDALKKGAGEEEGGLRGAALDVTDPEPLPRDSELWGLENVIVTPHVSGVSAAYAERSFQVLDLNLERREKGERLVNVVDRKKGY